MKKLLIIAFVVISAVAAAATLKETNKNIDQPKSVQSDVVDAPRNAQVATWD
ncbi:MAG: hypothetical protein KJ712_00535 [Bacteroidetes bacterium]|nr:hypothetical protein [Pseudopedobacter sp.]MBU1371416.1 hypothetical protein [Bacteroidota bacterium]MBU1483981.1 hypothetical protein [Bacteroidota bacterium]MBU2045198.1 hypothetical protein [Bacteroidota bacterium]MBU2267367.1 hypothetical protein [Bacteroidota bacterium]